MSFTLFPAIDMRRGCCVRLRQGQADSEILYSEDPAAIAAQWQEQGATWLHVVNLDGALDTPDDWEGPNLAALRRILAIAKIPVQFGGGIRTLASAEKILALGVHRVIFGTVAVSNPELIGQAVAAFGAEKVVVSLDAKDGFVATHGWVSTSQTSAADLGRQLYSLGLRTAVHTDISRDCMLTGANIPASITLAQATRLEVIVSGGVAGIEDVINAASHAQDGLCGIITGQALYSGRLSLPEALQAISARS